MAARKGLGSRKRLSAHKAAKILEDGSVRGHALTGRQRKFMGAVAHGMVPRGGRRRKY